MPKPHKIIILWVIMLITLVSKSQTLINTIGTPITENFNSLTSSNSLSSWVQNATLKDWYAYEMDPYNKPIDYSGDSGTGTSGRLYSYGRAFRNDRALGSLCSGSNDTIVFGWRLKNNTSMKTDSLKISYTGEQWRRSSGTAANKLLFFYKVASSIVGIDSVTIRNLTGKGFTYFSGLDFSSPQTGTTTSSLNGNDIANSKFLSQKISVSITPGEEIMLLWLDDDEAGNDHGLAIDNVSVTLLTNPDKVPLVTIDEIKQLDTNGRNLNLNKKVEIRGTVYGINYESSGLKFVIRDSSNGIVAYSAFKNFGYNVNEGDSIHIIGKVSQTEGLTLILIDTIFKKNKSKIALKNPSYITLPNENFEADLVKITNLQMAQNLKFWPKDNFVKFLQGSDTLSVFIDKETDIDSSEIPLALSFSITGFVFQSSNSPKLNNGYFMVPRSLKDIQFILPPSVSFVKINLTVLEKDTAFIELKIKNPNANKTLVIIDKKGGTATVNSDYISSLPLTISFPAWSDSTQWFKIPMVNDAFDEPDKTLELVIKTINNEGKILKDSNITITIQDNDNPLYPIKFASKINSFGVPDSNNVKIQVQGIVYGLNYRPAGLQFTIRDSIGGMGVFHPVGNFGYEVMEGDEILVSGTISHFRGLTQLISIDTVLKLNSGLVLKSPVEVFQLDEFSESNLVKIKELRWAQPKPNKWIANSTYKFTNGKDTFQVRIDGDINMAETATPTYDVLNITGIGSQVSTFSAGPFLDGYLLYPRYSSDIEKQEIQASLKKIQTNFVSVFPNPSNGNFEIISSKPITAISVISTTGETILNSKYPNLLQKSLNLNLPKGIYLIKIVSENNFVYKRIMIK